MSFPIRTSNPLATAFSPKSDMVDRTALQNLISTSSTIPGTLSLFCHSEEDRSFRKSFSDVRTDLLLHVWAMVDVENYLYYTLLISFVCLI